MSSSSVQTPACSLGRKNAASMPKVILGRVTSVSANRELIMMKSEYVVKFLVESFRATACRKVTYVALL